MQTCSRWRNTERGSYFHPHTFGFSLSNLWLNRARCYTHAYKTKLFFQFYKITVTETKREILHNFKELGTTEGHNLTSKRKHKNKVSETVSQPPAAVVSVQRDGRKPISPEWTIPKKSLPTLETTNGHSTPTLWKILAGFLSFSQIRKQSKGPVVVSKTL